MVGEIALIRGITKDEREEEFRLSWEFLLNDHSPPNKLAKGLDIIDVVEPLHVL